MTQLGANAPVQGFTERAKQTALALQAGAFVWMPAEGPQDALWVNANIGPALHVVRLDTPRPGEQADDYTSRVADRVHEWWNVPNVAYCPGNEPTIDAGWSLAAWLAAAHEYTLAMKVWFPGIRLTSVPLKVEETGSLTLDAVLNCDYCNVHSYIEAPHWDDIENEGLGASWKTALRFGAPIIVSEFGCVGGQDAPTIIRWVQEMDAGGVVAAMLFILDGVGTQWAALDVSIEMAAAIRAGTIPPPVPDPPPEPQPMNPYVYDGDYTYATFTAMVAGALARKNPSVTSRDNYLAVHAAAKQRNISVATLLGWIVAENVDPDLIAVNNLAGIYYVGQSRATPGPLGPANEGSKPYCAFATLTDFWVTLAINIETIDPDAWTRGDLRSIARTYTGGTQGYAKVDIVDALRDAARFPHGTLEDAPAPSSGVTGEQIAAEALTQLNHVRSGDYDTRNGDHPWYLWCESFVERVHEHCGVTVAAAISAADQGRAMEAAGRLHRGDPNAPRGAVHFWDEGFWADGGHTAISLGDGTFVGTVSPEGVGIRSGWQGRAGYMGWAWYPGVGEAIAPVEEIDMLVETGFDPGILRRQWDGPKTKAAIKKVGSIDPNRAIDDKWIAELKAGRPLGFAISNEEGDPASGRVVRFFANGRITFFTADGSVKVN
jgi:hypothetical protein